MLNFTSCSEDDLDPKSIFEDQPTSEQNDFDKWILANYTMPYNIALKYHMEDIESNHDYTLALLIMINRKLAHIVKYAWLETYDEVAGIRLYASVCAQSSSFGRFRCLRGQWNDGA